MKNLDRCPRDRQGYSLVELLTVILMLSALTSISIPAYRTSVSQSRQSAANQNAKALADAVELRSRTYGNVDSKVVDYAADFGGTLPENPCTHSPDGYVISVWGKSAIVSAVKGNSCGNWIPSQYRFTL